MAKTCKHCGLVNPPQAQRCDCGYDFQTQGIERSYLDAKQIRVAAATVGGWGTAFVVIYLLFRGAAVLRGLAMAGN